MMLIFILFLIAVVIIEANKSLMLGKQIFGEGKFLSNISVTAILRN
jgi:hypothetical protein